jgi:hypothetical protein
MYFGGLFGFFIFWKLLRARTVIETNRLNDATQIERAKLAAVGEAETIAIKTKAEVERLRALAVADAEGVSLKRNAEIDNIATLCEAAHKLGIDAKDVAVVLKARGKMPFYEKMDQSKPTIFITKDGKPTTQLADQASLLATTAIAHQLKQ